MFWSVLSYCFSQQKRQTSNLKKKKKKTAPYVLNSFKLKPNHTNRKTQIPETKPAFERSKPYHQPESRAKRENLLTRRILEASERSTVEEVLARCELAAEDARQSATARRSGSGGFFIDEDLSLETPPTPPPT